MSKNYLAWGYHDALGDGRNATGVGDWMRSLDAAGIPFTQKSVGIMPWDGQEIARNSDLPHAVIYRKEGREWDVPDYDKPAHEAAVEHWNKHIAELPPELDKSITWIETINEIAQHFDYDPDEIPPHPVIDGRTITDFVDEDGNPKKRLSNAAWLGKFAGRTAELAVQQGYKWLAFGWSSGEPEPEVWDVLQMRNFLNFAQTNFRNIGIALHEYSYNKDYLFDPNPEARHAWIGRYKELKKRFPRLRIFITEWGWEYQDVPPYEEARAEMEEAAQMYLEDGVESIAIWQIGGGAKGNWGQIANQVNGYFEPMRQDLLNGSLSHEWESNPTEPPIDPVPPVEPPNNGYWTLFDPYNRTYLLHPRELNADQRQIINTWLKEGVPGSLIDENGARPVGFAGWTHQDPIDMIHQAQLTGETDSLLIVVDGEQIGTGLDMDWVLSNFPDLLPYFRFVSTAPTIPEPVPPSSGIVLRYWAIPNSRYITQLWGERPEVYQQYGLPGHEGHDVGAGQGTPIFAAQSGKVSHASQYRSGRPGYLSAYGFHVIIDHGGFSTLYAHLDPTLAVRAGQVVQAGQMLGKLGYKETPAENTTGPHLHFSIFAKNAPNNGYPNTIHGRYIDPAPYFKVSLPDPPSTSPPPSGGQYVGPPIKGGFIWGLDQPASDWDWNRVHSIFAETGMIPKFHTDGNNHQWFNQYKSGKFNIVRILINPSFQGDSAQIFNEIRGGVEPYYNMGQRDFILFNEPNIEGLGVRFTNGVNFSYMADDVARLLKSQYSGIRLWYPPVSPSGDGRISGWDFLNQAKSGAGFSQFYGMTEHVYTGNTTNVQAAVDGMVEEVKRFQGLYSIDKPLVIGEFSVNRPATASYKADVYTRLYQRLGAMAGLQGAYSFTASWFGGQSGQWGRDWDINQESWFEGGIRVQNQGA